MSRATRGAVPVRSFLKPEGWKARARRKARRRTKRAKLNRLRRGQYQKMVRLYLHAR